jgi:hypothetical protein
VAPGGAADGNLPVVTDGFSERYGDLLFGSYDCVDRIVLNAYNTLCYVPGGFRTWWRRLHDGSDEQLDNAHLMRMAGRFVRRVRAWAKAHGIPVIDCKRGERKQSMTEEYLAEHTVGTGVFLIFVARAVAPVWEVARSASGVIGNLAKKRSFAQPLLVSHHGSRMGASDDQDVRASPVRRAGHPQRPRVRRHPGASSRDRVRQGRQLLYPHRRPAALAQIADTLSQPATIGRLTQVCDRWIYTACLCLGLDREEQERSCFSYGYSVFQAEYTPQPAVHRGRPDGPGLRPGGGPDPVSAGRADAADFVRRQATPWPQPPPPTCRFSSQQCSRHLGMT